MGYPNYFQMIFNSNTYRRVVCETDLIIHCHHYNARIQRTIEQTRQVDGKHIITSSAEGVFDDFFQKLMTQVSEEERKNHNFLFDVASQLYQYLGFGLLNFSNINKGEVVSPSSHFVEGWNTGFEAKRNNVCSFTEGYLQGIYHAITGKTVYFNERQCMITGESECIFVLNEIRQEPLFKVQKLTAPLLKANRPAPIHSNINESAILDAVIGMPIYGNNEGLIPNFGVYLANMPADFYNLVSIRFVEEMQKKGLLKTAQRLLISDAETCGMNTFRGIINSPEWDALVSPMVKNSTDKLFGIIAISNALGWGNWRALEHTEGDSLLLESGNGYEALGFLTLRPPANEPQCFMLEGVAAGIMELIYGQGPLEERFGTYKTREVSCLAKGDGYCHFQVQRLK